MGNSKTIFGGCQSFRPGVASALARQALPACQILCSRDAPNRVTPAQGVRCGDRLRQDSVTFSPTEDVQK
jgi:hypothetical protein